MDKLEKFLTDMNEQIAKKREQRRNKEYIKKAKAIVRLLYNRFKDQNTDTISLKELHEVLMEVLPILIEGIETGAIEEYLISQRILNDIDKKVIRHKW